MPWSKIKCAVTKYWKAKKELKYHENAADCEKLPQTATKKLPNVTTYCNAIVPVSCQVKQMKNP